MRTILTSLAALTAFSLCAQVPSYVPTNGLVGWWPFNGNANDESGNGNNGVVNGATLTEDRFGNSNEAHSFTSGNSITSTPNLPIGNSPRSVSLWFQTTSLSYNINTGLEANSMVTYGSGIGVGGGANGQCNLETQVGILRLNHYAVGVSGPFVSDGIWHNATYTYDGNIHMLYLDNLLVNMASYAINTGITQLIIGNRASEPNWHPYNGKIDDVGIWNRALDECEIQALYNAGAQGVSPTPVSFSGLNSSYVLADQPSPLSGTPAGGVFIGPGVAGNTFDPASAGVGSHSITYAYVDACGSVNVQSFCTEVTVTSGVGGSNMTTSGVLVYPNPNRGQFTVELDLMGLVSLQVFDARGALVHNEVFTATGTRTQRSLDLSALAKGSYTLQVEHAGQRLSQSVVVE
jgi:hypothetical protein